MPAMSSVLFAIICALWGFSFLLMKKGLIAFGPLGVANLRLAFAGGILLLVFFARRPKWTITKKDIPPLIFIAFLGNALPFFLQPLVVGWVQESGGHGSAFTGLMITLVPLLTIIASIPLLRKHATWRQWVGVLGGLVMMLILFGSEMKLSVPILALVLGAATPLCYAVNNTYLKRRFANHAPLDLTICSLCIATIMTTPVAIAAEDAQFDHEKFWIAFGCIVILGVFATGVANYLFYILIHREGPLYASMVTYVIPVLSFALGWLDGESVNRVQAACLAGTLLMVAIVQFPSRKKKVDADQADAETIADTGGPGIAGALTTDVGEPEDDEAEDRPAKP